MVLRGELRHRHDKENAAGDEQRPDRDADQRHPPPQRDVPRVERIRDAVRNRAYRWRERLMRYDAWFGHGSRRLTSNELNHEGHKVHKELLLSWVARVECVASPVRSPTLPSLVARGEDTGL